jgi:hypothetical protein
MSRQKTVRTNKAYKLDNPVEGLVLAGRGVKALARLGFRYRTELGFLALVAVLYFGVRHEVGPRWATFCTLAAAVLVLSWGWSRRLVIGRLSCARTRRLVVEVFKQTRVENVAGQLPMIRRSIVTPAGERLIVWCRAGQSAELLDARVEELRAGARCRHVTVTRDPNRSHRVSIDVIRRETLAGVLVRSPLLDLAARLDPTHTEVQP